MATTPSTQFVPPTIAELTDQLAEIEKDLSESVEKESKLVALVSLNARVNEAKSKLDNSKRSIAEYEKRLASEVIPHS